ncbi:translation initiation factor if-2, partial [Plakobranchus ocellatus]
MLSSLARGYGTWTGSFDTAMPPAADFLPSLPPQTHDHRHGVTITPRSKTPYTEVPIAEDGHLEIPKTFVTRKGALVLFTAPDDTPQEPLKTPTPTPRRRRRKPKSVIDLSLKLKTLERLSLSVLQFGDQSYDKESASVSDKENPLVLNFLHHLEEAEKDDCDLHSQPGGDLKFYLRDLKRRASGRGLGASDGGIYRARSAELQDILDQLEKAWPHRAESTFGGSAPAGDEFFYPASPTPSVSTARSLSRSKVLSSQKLTASLKSLNYLGRPASTEPEHTGSVTENVTSPLHFRYGRSKSARPSVWVTDSSTPIYLRPRVTQHGTIFHPSAMQTPRAPSASARDAGDTTDMADVADGPTPAWLNVEGQENASIVSDDLQSQKSMADFELRAPSERGEYPSRPASRSDRPFTPGRSERSATPGKDERSVMLSEAASVLSSLMEEDYLTDPGYNASDDEMPVEREQWPGRDQVVESRAFSRLSGRDGTGKAVSDDGDKESGLPQPLQPLYAAPLTDVADQPGNDVIGHIELLEELEKDYVAASPDTAKSSQYTTADEATGSKVKPEQLTDKAGRPPSATPIAVDPDTLVSMHKDEQDYTEISTSLTIPERDIPRPASPKSELASQLRTPSPVFPPQPPSSSAPAEAHGQLSLAVTDDLLVVSQAQSSPAEVNEEIELEDEIVERKLVTPKRRQQPEEKRKSLIPEDLPDAAREATSGGEPQLSERVIKEQEEREKRAAQRKEEKEREEAAKQAEADKTKQEAEEKKLAAEERLKQRVEEAAKRKEEERLRREKEGETAEQVAADSAKSTKLVKKEKKKSDAKKSAKEAAKTEEAAKTNAKLDMLKAKSASGGEVDVEKLKQFMATQPPPPPPKVEKENVELPEHMKEMFERKTKSKTQEELEEEISRMKMAADQALGGSVLEAEGMDGLSAEDFASAQEALMEKIKKAEEEILEGRSASPKPTPPAKAKVATPKKTKAEKPSGSKKSPSPKRKKDPDAEKKQEQARKRAEQKEQEKLEKQRRLEEAKALQQKIKSKEETRKAKEAESKRKAEELQERMEAIRQEEEEIEQAEKDARAQLAAVRKAQREEREARRKADLEKKKQDAIDK